MRPDAAAPAAEPRCSGLQVQELVEKDSSPEVPEDLVWHFIGHLQSNKVNHIAGASRLCVYDASVSECVRCVLRRAAAVPLSLSPSLPPLLVREPQCMLLPAALTCPLRQRRRSTSNHATLVRTHPTQG